MGEIPLETLTADTRKLTKDWGREIKIDSGIFPIYRFNSKKPITGRHPGFIEYAKSTRRFCTRSTYEGNYNSVGFAGYGEYVYPHGVRYEGKFKDGMFHGKGDLIYPLGQRIEGMWKYGKLVNYVFKCSDGLEYSSPWKYCQPPDRRFQLEKTGGLQAAGQEFLTRKQPTKPLKPGCYDTVDGYFDSKVKCILKDEIIYLRDGDRTYRCRQNPDVLRVCTKNEEELIKGNYRKAEDEAIGYCPDLYKEWTTGQMSDTERKSKSTKKISEQSVSDHLTPSVTSSEKSSSDSTI